MAVAETALGVTLANAAAKAGAGALFKAASERLEKNLKGPAKGLGVKALAALTGYSAYIEETNERVSTFKTFADPTKPVSVLDHFVVTKFCLARSKRSITQDDILKKLSRPSRFVISATAGYGKSMVMRYLALAMFEAPSGKIPIFLELRNLNRVSTPDIISFINSSYRRNSTVQVESFRQALASGAVVLLLDGFDELNHDIREAVEDQILEISRSYPLTSIVVSGRPDDRFKAWKSFSLYKVQPMDQGQVVELINKLEYDRGVRKRFVQKIKSGLFQSHESFMSTPLLAILMLLTFEQNANIPDKMHLFYSEAFRTLFHKHDALKEQYARSRKSGLAVDDFEKVFSIFCLKTYVLEKLEFTEREIISYIKEALGFEKSDAKPEHFLFDIEEAICLFVKEGSSYFFVHRSFQEYFTALFLSSCPQGIRDEFIDQVANRYWDNVLPMLFDMAGDQIEPTWVSENCNRYLSEVGFEPGKIRPFEARFEAVKFYKYEGSYKVGSFDFGPFSPFISVMNRFYPETNSSHPLDFESLQKWATGTLDRTSEQTSELAAQRRVVPVMMRDIPREIIDKSGLRDMAESEYQDIVKVHSSLQKEQLAKNSFLEKLFSKERS